MEMSISSASGLPLPEAMPGGNNGWEYFSQ
jgi:hypothetical protein